MTPVFDKYSDGKWGKSPRTIRVAWAERPARAARSTRSNAQEADLVKQQSMKYQCAGLKSVASSILSGTKSDTRCSFSDDPVRHDPFPLVDAVLGTGSISHCKPERGARCWTGWKSGEHSHSGGYSICRCDLQSFMYPNGGAPYDTFKGYHSSFDFNHMRRERRPMKLGAAR